MKGTSKPPLWQAQRRRKRQYKRPLNMVYPLMPEKVMPSINLFCTKKYITITGRVISRAVAMASSFAEYQALLKNFHQQVVTVWSQSCKGQGLEILDLRLGGLIARADTACQRINAYLAGSIAELSELEETILPYNGVLPEDGVFPYYSTYGDIITTNTLSHVWLF